LDAEKRLIFADKKEKICVFCVRQPSPILKMYGREFLITTPRATHCRCHHVMMKTATALPH